QEIEALLLTGPDGETHRISRRTPSLPVLGLRSPATFAYRYVGRSPFSGATLSAYGDLLVVPEPSKTRQNVVVGFQAHAGYLWRPWFDTRGGSPTVDVGLVGLLRARWEISVAAALTEHPSVLRVDGEPDHWTSSPQVRLTAGVGYRWELERWFIAAGV